MRYMSPRQQRHAEWGRICEAFSFRCAYCNCLPTDLQREHLFPKVRGGGEELENIVPACGNCNAAKNHLTPLEWFLERLGWPINFRKRPRTRWVEPPEPKRRRAHPLARDTSDHCAICGHRSVRPVILMDDPRFPVRDLCTHCYADPAEFPRIASLVAPRPRLRGEQ